MALRPVLLYGEFSRDDLSRVSEAAEQATSAVTRADSLEQAMAWLESNDAQALLCHSDESEQLAVQTRSRARLSKLPVLALTQAVSDLEFVAAFSWGADDVVPLQPARPLLTRLRALPKEPPPPPVEKRGEALVAELEQTRRVSVARVLRNAGYAIRFAVSAGDAEHFAADPKLALVVGNTELVPDARTLVESAREAGSRANFIVCAAPRDIKHQRARLASISGVTVTDGFTAPENILFVANELSGGRTSGRGSARVPYGTVVAFRGAGREIDEHGFSYNISEKGLYVRSLALPEDDEVWLELRPPRQERHVRLVGRVAWRRPFNYNESATVPPGFGVEITDGAAKDRALWGEGYSKLLEAVG
ncbi:MAG TPA: PilZ domain-containing protein [Polyangiaceae bacterium]